MMKYFFSVLFLFLTACQVPVTYYIKSAVNQVSILNKRKDIAKVLADPEVKEETKAKLKLASQAKEFAETKLGLKKTGNYSTYVSLDRPYVSYVVSASPKWELKHHQWSYLIVGAMPYKGFSSQEEAKDEEAYLKKQDLDTYLRGVSAYSTLGWFDDPILSSMMSYSNHDLVNTIIHETVHTTLYIKNSADFNERLAVFIGNMGTEMFYTQLEGPESATLKSAANENEDDKLFSNFISAELKDLEIWYKNQSSHNEELRQARLKEIQEKFKRDLLPKLKSESLKYFTKIELNNARLNLYKTYMQDLSDFESLYNKLGRDLIKFMDKCKSLESHPKPEQGLKELIAQSQN